MKTPSARVIKTCYLVYSAILGLDQIRRKRLSSGETDLLKASRATGVNLLLRHRRQALSRRSLPSVPGTTPVCHSLWDQAPNTARRNPPSSSQRNTTQLPNNLALGRHVCVSDDYSF